MYNVLIIFGILAAVSAGIAVFLGAKCLKKERRGARYMGEMCFAAAAVDLFYFISILPVSYRFMSVMSSLYFISIDVMLMCLLTYTLSFTSHDKEKKSVIILSVLGVWGVVDIAILLVNSVREIAVHYEFRDTLFACYRYERGVLFNCHLVLAYVMIAIVLILLLQRIVTVPDEYRSQYIFVIFGIMAVVFINAIFLFLPGNSMANLIDWSLLGYSIATFVYYWISFQYATHGMLNHHKSVIFENIGQGLVLFDYMDELILANEKSKMLLRSIDFRQSLTREHFINELGLGIEAENKDEACSLQCEVDGQFLRCDHSVIENKKKRQLGHLFVFTNASQETDLATGFQNLDSFRQMIEYGNTYFPVPTTAVVFDINNLNLINMRYGRAEGDRRIRELAEQMRRAFPKGTYFVRGTDAQMIAICSHEPEISAKAYVIGFMEDVEYAAAATAYEQPNVYRAVQSAIDALNNKKMMDSSSVHHVLVNSLMKVLEQCDPDTTDHVKRTQILGEKLGARIRLSDFEQSQLSLLCMLHDVGKIGIPLEVLNKPGKLNDEEWKIMQSHVRKGYEMAKNSKELAPIADAILHHHERWDGEGYPDGLDRESIPLLSRVIAVVDAYDAMTHDRVYKKAMPKMAAQKELLREAGKQFDPRLVSEFLGLFYENDGKKKQEELAAELENERALSADKAETESWGTVLAEMESTSVHEIPCSELFMDEHLNVLSADDRFEKITGYKAEEIRTYLDLLPKKDRTAWLANFNAAMAGNNLFVLEHFLQKKDGSTIYVSSCGRLHFNAAQKANRIAVLLVNTEESSGKRMQQQEEEEKAKIRMRRWADHYRMDSLTGVLAHEPFVHDVEEALIRGEQNVLMIMMDVDHFKTFNDTYGHQKGDELLRTTAGALKNAIRGTDLTGRMGGDEFAAALFFKHGEDRVTIARVVENVFAAVSRDVDAFSPGQKVSMGAALSGEEIDTFEKLYKKADHQLYVSKESGRGRVTIAQ